MTGATSLQIRKPTADELPHLAEIERAAAALFPPERLPDPEGTLPIAELLQAQADGHLFVACLDTTLVGFALVQRHNPYLHLLEMSVDPVFGRRGVGRGLLNHVLDTGQQLAAQAVTLTTFEDIAWNAPFYASAGFTKIDESALPLHVIEHLQNERSEGLTQRIGMMHCFQ